MYKADNTDLFKINDKTFRHINERISSLLKSNIHSSIITTIENVKYMNL